MSIKIEIAIPNEEVTEGRVALERRMAVLGYSFGAAAGYVLPPDDEHYGKGANLPAAMPAVEHEKVKSEADEPKKRGRKAKADAPAEDKPQISTQPENRVEPEAVDDDETAEQDAADEAAEVEATRAPEKPLTLDDVKNAMGAYVSAFDMNAAQEDGVKIFADALGLPPTGNSAWKLSLLAEASQEVLQKAVDAWRKAASAGKRYGGA